LAADASIESLRSPSSKVKAEDGTAVHHTLPHYSIEYPSDEEVLQSPDLKPDPDIAYPDDDTESLEALVKSEGEEPEDSGHIAFVKRQQAFPPGSWYDPQPGHSQLIKADQEQDQVVELDTIHDDAGDDDEPIIVKVESAVERERQRAAQAEQELGRLQKEQLQAKFDHAIHRKDQV
jgi:hypothetical protein